MELLQLVEYPRIVPVQPHSKGEEVEHEAGGS